MPCVIEAGGSHVMAGVVPEKILWNRRKVGFNAPVFSFLDVKDVGVKAWVLAESPIFDHVRKDRIGELLQKDYLENSESKFLFSSSCLCGFVVQSGFVVRERKSA